LTGPGNTTWADWQVLLYTTGVYFIFRGKATVDADSY